MSNEESDRITPERSDPVLILVKGDCSRCPYQKKGKCAFPTMHKCKCEKPEFGTLYYAGLNEFGLCKNCGHFIVKIKKEQWQHYRPPYNCKVPPYSAKICNAPMSKTAMKQRESRIKKNEQNNQTNKQ